jgi:hypothetical protein
MQSMAARKRFLRLTQTVAAKQTVRRIATAAIVATAIVAATIFVHRGGLFRGPPLHVKMDDDENAAPLSTRS